MDWRQLHCLALHWLGFRKEIAEAKEAGRPVSIGAARHSMGGQAIPARGHAITYDNAFLETDRSNPNHHLNDKHLKFQYVFFNI